MKKIIALFVACMAMNAQAQLGSSCIFNWTGNTSGDLNDTNNWAQLDPADTSNPLASDPAERLPIESDTVFVNGNYVGTQEPTSGICTSYFVHLAYADAAGTYIPTTGAIVTEPFSGTIVGSAIFSGAAVNNGIVLSSAIFEDTTYNSGTVSGDAGFWDSAVNAGTVSGTIVMPVPPVRGDLAGRSGMGMGQWVCDGVS